MPNTYQTINPASEDVIAKYTYFSQEEVIEKIENTSRAWRRWHTSSYAQRANLLLNLAATLRRNKEALGRLITTEMGKPLSQSIAEVEKCAWVCEYYAKNGPAFLQDESIETEATESFVHYSPLGPVLAIMPWNYPFWQVFRFAAPAMMAGNAAVLKHSANTTGCALKMEDLFIEAGFPENLFTVILVDSSQDMEYIFKHPEIKAVTLTGSTKVGRSVASLAGKHLKKTVLELGGSDPYLVLDDANLDLAAETCVAGRILNTGQSCIAAKRFIVTQKNEKQFIEKVKAILSKKKTTDPLAKGADLGPMARRDLTKDLHEQVQKSIEHGAVREFQGEIPNTKGYYYPLTLLTNVRKGMPAYSEELFGPVASIITAENEEEAIHIANDTSFGLGSAIFSEDTSRAREIARSRMEAGCCFINDFVKSDPRLPFGGIKESGYGRELSLLGIREFLNAKSIFIK